MGEPSSFSSYTDAIDFHPVQHECAAGLGSPRKGIWVGLKIYDFLKFLEFLKILVDHTYRWWYSIVIRRKDSMKSFLSISARREGYAVDQISNTMTVGELKRLLEDYDEDMEVYISNDNGYTYGGITEGRIDMEYAEEEEEEEDEE